MNEYEVNQKNKGPSGQRQGNALLVDADPKTEAVTRRELVAEGYDVRSYPDAIRVLRLLEGKFLRQVYDWTPSIILVDISLPKLSGYEFVRRVIECSYAPKTPILMMAQHYSYEDQIEAYNVGAHGLLTKPLDLTEFRTLVENYRSRQNRMKSGKLVFDGSLD